jgi:hypothetical protein
MELLPMVSFSLMPRIGRKMQVMRRDFSAGMTGWIQIRGNRGLDNNELWPIHWTLGKGGGNLSTHKNSKGEQ